MGKLMINFRPQHPPLGKQHRSDYASCHCLMFGWGWGGRMYNGENKTLQYFYQSVLLLLHCLDASAGLGQFQLYSFQKIGQYL